MKALQDLDLPDLVLLYQAVLKWHADDSKTDELQQTD
ncbi:MAG: hypothetical protein BWY85_00023 [Firmicutes bacterium ADurb.Bin506]|nr:MAG: hypothetical protein BWY85_00023 [Firmicutes bacterium ADurb.Bin506]